MNPTTHVQMIGNEVREGNNVVNVWYTNTSGTTCVHVCVCVCRELRAHGDGVRPSVLRPQPPPSPTRAPCPALPCQPASQPASQPPALARSLIGAHTHPRVAFPPRCSPAVPPPLVRSFAAATTTRGLGCTARAWPTSWTSTASRSWTGAWAR